VKGDASVVDAARVKVVDVEGVTIPVLDGTTKAVADVARRRRPQNFMVFI